MDNKTMKRLPQEIEAESFRMITEELGDRSFPAEQEAVIKRVIHTTADFDYADQLYFSDDAVRQAHQAIKEGAVIVTDTQMARAGINKRAAAAFGCEIHCFMDDAAVALAAKENGGTRAAAAVDKAAQCFADGIFVVGNAPTALLRICELMKEGRLRPRLVVGVPVGFVNVIESKELLMAATAPCIVARGRKGGSNVAAAICNALFYALEAKQ